MRTDKKTSAMPGKQGLVISTSADGKIEVEATFHDGNLWLTLNQISELFGKDKSTINRHIKNILLDCELDAAATVAKIATVQNEGKRQVSRNFEYYNLDMIIAVAYRVNSFHAIQFRIWATKILREYLQKGFAMNDLKLKDLGGAEYWQGLLERV
jgi:hypothetical protein